jgi:regulator of replication initiation timing
MAARRFEDVLFREEINKLRLENLNLKKKNTLLEPLIETDAKHTENITNTSVAKKENIEKIFHDATQPPDGFG